MYNRILVAYDGSDCLGRAPQEGLRLAKDQRATERVVRILDESVSTSVGSNNLSNLTSPVRLSVALGVALFVEAVAGLFVPHLYKDAPVWIAQARGVSLVDLIIGLPLLIASLALAVGGSRRALIVWAGVLGYILGRVSQDGPRSGIQQ